MLETTAFDEQWKAAGAGELDGAEHQIYPTRDGRWRKRNDLIFHGTWLEYFHRLALHRWLFPDTAYEFEGFMDVNGRLCAVSSQKSIRAAEGAGREAVSEEMRQMGFVSVWGDDYYHPRLGVLVEDLHDENAVIAPTGSLIIFDPVIYLAKAEMFQEGGKLYGQNYRAGFNSQ